MVSIEGWVHHPAMPLLSTEEGAMRPSLSEDQGCHACWCAELSSQVTPRHPGGDALTLALDDAHPHITTANPSFSANQKYLYFV